MTGAAAAVRANEELTAAELKTRLTSTVDRLSNLQSKIKGGRRINLENALDNIVQAQITQNDPEDDFDENGYHPTQSELYELFSAGGKVIQVSAGENHTLALKDDGTVWSWGYNYFSQLGDGSTITRTAPVQVIGLTDVVYIEASLLHSLAVKSDGTVWVWGSNTHCQSSGANISQYYISPVQVIGLAGAISGAAGDFFSLALKGDGTIWAWGDNTHNELGLPFTKYYLTPIQPQIAPPPTPAGIAFQKPGYTLAIPCICPVT